MTEICRVCREGAATLMDIFAVQSQQSDEPSLAEMISECTSCEVNRNDPLPQQMCATCVQDAQNCFRFKRKCKQSHLFFLQQLGTMEMLETADFTLDAWPINSSREAERCSEEKMQPNIESYKLKDIQSKTTNSTWHPDAVAALQQPFKDNSFIECDVQFETSSRSSNELELILRSTSSDSKRNFCSICGKEFTSIRKLNVHERFHSRKREHKCPQCPKEFLNPGNLADHIRAHTGERPYECPHCVKAFTQRGRLNEHIRTHTGERPFQCQDCPRSFASAGNLTVHKRIHTGERPHKCSLCHAAYAQPSALQRHVRAHTAERPFKCAICIVSFSKISYLKRHMHSHSDALGNPIKEEDYVMESPLKKEIDI